jgi:ribose 5-phosphate isomerase B
VTVIEFFPGGRWYDQPQLRRHALDQTNYRIWIGNDHGGYQLKQHVLDYLGYKNIYVHDAGSDSEVIVRYPHYAAQVCEAILSGEADRGILICSTGIGMSIIANRYAGIRASLCTNTDMGRLTRAHNDSNVLCLGGRITSTGEALDILEAWLSTPYEGGRHDISLGLIREGEQALTSGQLWRPQVPVDSAK